MEAIYQLEERVSQWCIWAGEAELARHADSNAQAPAMAFPAGMHRVRARTVGFYCRDDQHTEIVGSDFWHPVWVHHDDTEKGFRDCSEDRAEPDWWFVIYGPSSVANAISEHPSEQMADARRGGLAIPTATTANGSAASAGDGNRSSSDMRARGRTDTPPGVRRGTGHGARRTYGSHTPRHMVSPALESWNGDVAGYHYSAHNELNGAEGLYMGNGQQTTEKQSRRYEGAVSPQWDRPAGRGPVRVEYVTEYWTEESAQHHEQHHEQQRQGYTCPRRTWEQQCPGFTPTSRMPTAAVLQQTLRSRETKRRGVESADGHETVRSKQDVDVKNVQSGRLPRAGGNGKTRGLFHEKQLRFEEALFL